MNLSRDPLRDLERDWVFIAREIIHVINADNISWAERKMMADTLLHIRASYRSMRKEQEYLMQDRGGGGAMQQRQGEPPAAESSPQGKP